MFLFWLCGTIWVKMTQKWRNRLNWLRCGERSWSGSKKELRCSDDGMHAFSSPSLSEKERRVFFLCYKVGFLSNRVRPEPFAEKKCLRYGRFPLSRHTIIYRRRRLCQLGPAVKRESIDSMMNNAVDGFFFVEAQSAHSVCGRKEGGSVPVAERVVRRTGGKGPKVGRRGMKKCGDALSKRARESKRHAENRKSSRDNRKSARENRKTKGAQSKNKESPNQSAGAEIRKSARLGIRKRTGRGIRKRAIYPPPCRDEEFG